MSHAYDQPLPITPTLTQHLNACTRRARDYRAARLITPAQYVVLDFLIGRLRRKDFSETQVSYWGISIATGLSRSTVAAAIKVLKGLGLLAWQKTRLVIRHALGTAIRQGKNIYHFLVPPPIAAQTEPEPEPAAEVVIVPPAPVSEIDEKAPTSASKNAAPESENRPVDSLKESSLSSFVPGVLSKKRGSGRRLWGRPEPVDPVRTVAEQIAFLMACEKG